MQVLKLLNKIFFVERYKMVWRLETKQKSSHYVFVWVYVNLCTVTVIELIAAIFV
jgi:hypothetical protein